MDLSGSMYTFNRIDGRKTRLLETALFFMQSLDGLDAEYEYSMVGHSGSGPEAEKLIAWGEPPQGERKRLQLLQKMAAHTQYCHPGDQTYEASALAIKETADRAADERFVFIVSDADLARYGKAPAEWNAILTSTPSVRAYAVLIASNEQEADRISAALDIGKGYMCTDTAQVRLLADRPDRELALLASRALPPPLLMRALTVSPNCRRQLASTFEKIFQSSVAAQ